MRKFMFISSLAVMLLSGCTEASEVDMYEEEPIVEETLEPYNREHPRFEAGDYFNRTNAEVYALTDKETGCKYIVVSDNSYGTGSAITPLLQADGTPECRDTVN